MEENSTLKALCQMEQEGGITREKLELLLEMYHSGSFKDLLMIVQNHLITVLNDESGKSLDEFRAMNCRYSLPDIMKQLTDIACE